jgi:hypothetical protein
VGAGVAFTGGVKLLPAVGLMLFSVGDGVADGEVVGVVLEGLGDSLPPQPAVNAPIAMIALPPATSASRRAIRSDFIVLVQSNPRCGPLQGLRASEEATLMSILVEHSEQTLAKFPHSLSPTVHVTTSKAHRRPEFGG